MRRAITAVVLAALWLLMSGLYDPLILSFGAASVGIVLWIMARMDKADGDHLDWHLKPAAFIGYILWLMGEIAKANWAVTRVVLYRGKALNQHIFTVPATQHTDIGQVMFANSITLTPGTISIETEPGQFLVHALEYSEGDLAAIADMDARVTACEKPPLTRGGG